MLDLGDTIAAIASAPGAGARGIVRLSGPQVIPILQRLAPPTVSGDGVGLRRPTRYQTVVQGPLEQSVDSPEADRGIRIPVAVQLWPTRKSYTGEPLAEWHMTGSPPLLEAALALLFRHGARPARPGEFTLRAFLSGRIDLVQAEAVLGVIDAQDRGELLQALEQLAGGVSQPLMRIRSDLMDLLADVEAGLDFVDEGIEFVSNEQLLARIRLARREIDRTIAQATSRSRTRVQPRVVLAGLTNAGKSTLFNALAGRPMALVASERGTTRDWLTAEIALDGLALELVDTAGWDRPDSEVDVQMQTAREDQWHKADLVVWCTPADLPAEQRTHNEQLRRELEHSGRIVLDVLTKCDLDATDHSPAGENPVTPQVRVSAQSGRGLEQLRRAVRTFFEERPAESGWLGSTSARCYDSLVEAADSLRQAEQLAMETAGEELIAMELRGALDGLGRILGTVYTEDILDRIFSRFCIGK